MSTQVTLPSGFTATIREAKHVRYGAWEDLMQEIDTNPDGSTPETSANTIAYRRGMISLGVVSWDVRDIDDDGNPVGEVLPLPSEGTDVLRKLPATDVVYLFTQCRPLQAAFTPDFGPDPSPDSPTTPSGG